MDFKGGHSEYGFDFQGGKIFLQLIMDFSAFHYLTELILNCQNSFETKDFVTYIVQSLVDKRD